MKPEDNADSTGVIDLTSDIEPDSASSPSRANQKRPSSPSPATRADVDADVNMDEADASQPPSTNEADDGDFDIDALMTEEEERLAKMRAESSASASAASPSVVAAVLAPQTVKATYRDAGTDDDDEAMWAELNGLEDDSFPPSPPPPRAAPAQTLPDEDEDMWDVVREMDTGMEDAQQQPYVPPPPPIEEVQIPLPEPEVALSTVNISANVDEEAEEKQLVCEEKRATNDEDWEDMYLWYI
jgi:hypothetical protein